jgi:hypothetical protein
MKAINISAKFLKLDVERDMQRSFLKMKDIKMFMALIQAIPYSK